MLKIYEGALPQAVALLSAAIIRGCSSDQVFTASEPFEIVFAVQSLD